MQGKTSPCTYLNSISVLLEDVFDCRVKVTAGVDDEQVFARHDEGDQSFQKVGLKNANFMSLGLRKEFGTEACNARHAIF